MSAFAGAAARAGRAGRGLVPTGQLLTPEVWARRHRVAEVSPMVVFALAAALPAFGRRARRRPSSA